MTRAEMVQWLRGWDNDAAGMADAATELERLGAIADAAVAYVIGARDDYAYAATQADTQEVREFDELRRVVEERAADEVNALAAKYAAQDGK